MWRGEPWCEIRHSLDHFTQQIALKSLFQLSPWHRSARSRICPLPISLTLFFMVYCTWHRRTKSITINHKVAMDHTEFRIFNPCDDSKHSETMKMMRMFERPKPQRHNQINDITKGRATTHKPFKRPETDTTKTIDKFATIISELNCDFQANGFFFFWVISQATTTQYRLQIACIHNSIRQTIYWTDGNKSIRHRGFFFDSCSCHFGLLEFYIQITNRLKFNTFRIATARLGDTNFWYLMNINKNE